MNATKKIKSRIYPEIFCLLPFIIYLPFIFMGYGSDVDTYRVLDTWSNFLATNDYIPSRLPGYVIHELGTYLITRLDGSVLSNAVSLLFSILTCIFFVKIIKRFSLPVESVLLIILNPVYLVHSTSTTDFVWALCFFCAGIYLLLDRKIIGAAIALGFSSAIRLSYGLLIFVVLILFLFVYIRKDRKIINLFLVAIGLIFLINFLAYYLPVDFTEWRLKSFFHVSTGDQTLWSPLMRVGRWAYKNLLFWGIPTAFILIGLILNKAGTIKSQWRSQNQVILLCALIILFFAECTFFLYPIEIEYLLPILPFTAIVLAFMYKEKRTVLILLSILMLLNGLYIIQLARPDVANQASSAKLDISITEGYLLSDISHRILLRDCDSRECYSAPISQPILE